MSANFSISSCRAVFGVEPNCELPSSLPISRNAPFLGDVERGQFEANPDIAGIGILIGFFGVTYCAVISHLACLILGLLARSNRREPYRIMPLIRRFAFVCSDQQLLTGVAYTVSVRYRTGCSLSGYHYAIAQNTLLAIAITQAVASSAFVSFARRDFLLTFVRLAGAIPFWVLGSLFLKVPIDDKFDNEKQGPLFVLSALCFTDEYYGLGTDNELQVRARFPVMAMLFMLAMAAWVTSVLATLVPMVIKWMDPEGPDDYEETDVGDRKWRAYFFGVIIALGLALLIYATVETGNMRSRVYKSGWLDVSNGNAEQDLSALGQLIPVVLLVFTAYPILDMMLGMDSDGK
ncbi:hypothetical protein QBC34DRAFT_430196 [Podospora aff. communis PSN243]|uniref:Uncharacterized protein n=1 Tax=Podospora aff. communis PSN243 TaxID=3040156 RepID=A0AAV9G6G4_9PEZI|nr:hypothetical protein QBC34DRAFT_430196 [Podospora aff. communis PSN243]